MNEPSPVIAELPPHIDPTGQSRFVLFLAGDTNNTDQDNLIEEGYFDNCYAFELFLEDVQHRPALLTGLRHWRRRWPGSGIPLREGRAEQRLCAEVHCSHPCMPQNP